ncbi:hypothetical protein IMG5_036340 [Ichthyophthirius multifiliis]|uniref:Uncharacterized protein n=1 Tax=Ichthyophthirius multifiliis TaxID=5932 RepID=G0QLT7_ICHMU|nr:hypothetical protein IMG5_036340 [Ichthyophthirius multifiliis]EGR33818.1 hypothetical protein IMG5_036340 [Ichthyophthirius multifiliis]|eukprot:XP_004039042.1 hypothetical protein IMG5_036340 [Ichthyophthirius multifiliis]
MIICINKIEIKIMIMIFLNKSLKIQIKTKNQLIYLFYNRKTINQKEMKFVENLSFIKKMIKKRIKEQLNREFGVNLIIDNQKTTRMIKHRQFLKLLCLYTKICKLMEVFKLQIRKIILKKTHLVLIKINFLIWVVHQITINKKIKLI